MNRALKEEDLTVAIALYQSKYNTISPSEADGWMEDNEDYVRLTEPVTVTFKSLSDADVLAARVAMLDAQIKEVRARLTQKVNGLEEQKQRLLAITHD